MSDDLPDEAKVRKDLFWGMYTDLRTHARHAETLRANVINVMIVIASVLVAVISSDGEVERGDLLMCVAVIVIGLFGLAFAASYTELYERNRRRAIGFRDELDGEFFAATERTIKSLLDDADTAHRTTVIYRLGRALPGSTQRFWLLLPAFVVAAGITLMTVAL